MRKSALRLQSTYVLLLTGGILSACVAACGGSAATGGSEGADTGTDAAEGEGGATGDDGAVAGDDGASSTADGGAEDAGTMDSTVRETGSESDAAADASMPSEAGGDSISPSEAGSDAPETSDAASDSASVHDSEPDAAVDSSTVSEAGGDSGLLGDAAPDSSVTTGSDAESEAAVDAGASAEAGAEGGSVPDASAEAAVDAASDANLCGNGVVDTDEQCDLGSQNSDLFSSCSTTCTTTSLLLHLDASNPAGNGTTPADGTAMSSWVDLATGRSVVQTTSASQPLFRTSAVNGKPAFQFDGVSTFFDADLNINASVLPQVTIVVVLDNIAGDTRPYSGVWGADLGGWGRFMSAVGTGGSGVSNGGGFTFISGLNDDATRIVSTTLLDGATVNGSAAYINGTLSTNFTGSTNTNDTGLSIGSLNGPSHFISGYQEDGYIAEVLVYGTVLSDADRQTVETALMAKY